MTSSLLDGMKAMFDFNQVQNIDEGMIIPLNRWLSFEQSNLPFCLQMNKYVYWIDPRVAKYALHFGINKNKKFVQYIKKPEKDEKLDFLKELLSEYYGWADKELKDNWKVVELLLQDKAYCEQLDAMFAFNKAECKVLGISEKKYIGQRRMLNMKKDKSLEEWL